MSGTRRLARNPPTDSRTSQRLSQQAQRDTGPELAIRQRLFRFGYRYRVHYRLPGLRRYADIAFPGRNVAVFVDGCFWHGCALHSSVPSKNRDWWLAKIAANVDRDADTERKLIESGWRVVRVWEHEDADAAVARIREVVGPPRA